MKKLVLLAVAALFLGACSGTPDVSEIEKLVRSDLLDDGLGELFRMENFSKTNGFRQSDNIYIADVEYDLVFIKSFVDVVREIRADPTGPQYGLFGSKFILLAIQSNFGQFEAGDRIQKKEKVTLHNTEQGWRLAEN